MTSSHITRRMLQDANKFAYLVGAYPEKTVPEIINLFRISPVDINCAIWAAVELGFTSDMSAEDSHAYLLNPPEPWDFGENERDLEDAITYAFQKINAEEKDMEETFLGNWTQGYYPQDMLIATRRLLEDGVLHEYQIEDGDSSYIFYTLKENADKNWGVKQFKTNPLTGQENEAASAPAPDDTAKQ